MKQPKKILFGDQARKKLIEGINIVADAVGTTLGPKGNNVAINNLHTTPEIMHDGVTVARRINLKDPFKDMGAEFMKSVAEKTVQKVGDGTTTSTVLARAIIVEAEKQVAAGVKPQDIKRDLEFQLPTLIKELDKLTKKITTDEEVEQVATVSASDGELGKIVASAIKKVGKHGIVTIEEGKGFETTVEYKTGMEIDRGYISQGFETDRQRQEAVIEDPYILFTDKPLRYNSDLVPFMDKFLKDGRKNLVIFAETVADEALVTLVFNNAKGVIKVCCVQAPAFGDRRIDELTDMAAFTGGVVVSNDSGTRLETLEIEQLGRAEKVISDRDKTVIINGRGDASERVKVVEAQLAHPNSDFDEDIKERRLANLTGKAAVIHVGALDETSLHEKRERVIDAKNATQAAILGGIVPGGEVALYQLSKKATGILKNALRMPYNQLLANAGLDPADYAYLLNEAVITKDEGFGVDVMDGKFKNLLKTGIIDPALVTKSALESAVSIAGITLTTSVLITDHND